MKNKKEIDKEIIRLREIQSKRGGQQYDKVKLCPGCNSMMKYVYGELYKCPYCGKTELSDYGKVREFLEANGAQPIVISDNTGVDIDVINQFLREGRVEIPDGSDIYIRCEACGAEIRYGRFCPECMLSMTKQIGKMMWMPEVGEKPKIKGQSGKMHTLENLKENREKKQRRR